MHLTQKESTLLTDLISQEQLCIEKYGKGASCAQDTNLKTLFGQIEQVEKQHLDTLNQISGGTVPAMNSQAGGGQGTVQAVTTAAYSPTENSTGKQQDKYLCSDALSTEKHVSSLYNTCVFEFRDVNIRSALNHIQKEEQEHGEKIYGYMSLNGMYS